VTAALFPQIPATAEIYHCASGELTQCEGPCGSEVAEIYWQPDVMRWMCGDCKVVSDCEIAAGYYAELMAEDAVEN
jgi:hypothetical protein